MTSNPLLNLLIIFGILVISTIIALLLRFGDIVIEAHAQNVKLTKHQLLSIWLKLLHKNSPSIYAQIKNIKTKRRSVN